MPKLPLVAIIGRPNTGKSTLFNRIVRRRMAIENEVAGTTRDHIAHIVKRPEVDYMLLDTGGMGGGTDDKDFEDDVHAQSLLALQAADVILFTVDGKTDPTKNDFEIAKVLRRKSKRHVPVILVVTKCDNEKMLGQAIHAFHELGVEDEIIGISASHALGTDQLEESIVKHLKKLHFGKSVVEPEEEFYKNQEKTEEEEKKEYDWLTDPNRPPKVAIIGRPNVGKSSIINALMSDGQRAVSPKLVSPIAGTTRDSTDTVIRHEEKDYLFVDTAGLRRAAKVEWGVESISMLRSMNSIEQCDVAVLVIDGTEKVANQDKKIAGLAVEKGKGLIILLNKMDLLTSEQKKERMEDVKRNYLFCRYAPVVPCSAVTRDGISRMFALIDMAQRNRLRRIPQKELMTTYKDSVAGQPMTSLQSAKLITQANALPPTFVIFVKNPKVVQLSQLRFLENRFRKLFGFEGTPIRFITKGPRDRDFKE